MAERDKSSSRSCIAPENEKEETPVALPSPPDPAKGATVTYAARRRDATRSNGYLCSRRPCERYSSYIICPSSYVVSVPPRNARDRARARAKRAKRRRDVVTNYLRSARRAFADSSPDLADRASRLHLKRRIPVHCLLSRATTCIRCVYTVETKYIYIVYGTEQRKGRSLPDIPNILRSSLSE